METKEHYLAYIDKEMTIMGILSTFCIGLLALIFNKVVGIVNPQNWLLKQYIGSIYFPLTCFFVLLAALCFYKQRSKLAEYYGLISKALDRNENSEAEKRVDKVNYWYFWLWHEAGFACLWYVIIDSVLGYIAFVVQNTLLRSTFGQLVGSAIIMLVIILIFGFHAYIYYKFKSDDHPHIAWLKAFRKN